MRKLSYKKALIIAIFFAVFQAVMPLIGFHLGLSFSNKISAIDHWIIAILLVVIGFNMIKGALTNEKDCFIEEEESLQFFDLLALAVATSIDALAIGIGFAFLQVDIILAVFSIGIITFIMCVVGVKIGNVFGEKYSSKAEFMGGVILLLLGIKVLMEHMYF